MSCAHFVMQVRAHAYIRARTRTHTHARTRARTHYVQALTHTHLNVHTGRMFLIRRSPSLLWKRACRRISHAQTCGLSEPAPSPRLLIRHAYEFYAMWQVAKLCSSALSFGTKRVVICLCLCLCLHFLTLSGGSDQKIHHTRRGSKRVG